MSRRSTSGTPNNYSRPPPDHFKLRQLDLDEFREKVLESARGNPGQIIEMCRLAAQPQYHAGRYIKFSAIRIDTVTKFSL